MLKELKPGWWKTKRLFFKDTGPDGPKTRKYHVMDSNKGSIGVVHWHPPSNAYGFRSSNNKLTSGPYLVEIAEFMKHMTDNLPGRAWKLKQKERANRPKIMEKYLKKRLTKEQTCVSLDLVDEVVLPEKGLVEGCEAETPLGSLLGEITIE